jgi:hypothetical protein
MDLISGDTDDLVEANPESLARQQLMAELREASNLMAESVTPEAAKFWRNHVVELQARLRALHGEGGGSVPAVASAGSGGFFGASSPAMSAEELIRRNQSLLSSMDRMQQNSSPAMPSTGYVPPSPSTRAQQPSPAPVVPYSPSPALQERLRQQPSEDIDPNLHGVPMVDVVAPADLPGGYMFEAEIEERRFLATVPAGGVRKGETFCCYMRDLEKVGSDIPVGRWRDALTDCCIHGASNPVVWNALFCPLSKFAFFFWKTRIVCDIVGFVE